MSGFVSSIVVSMDETDDDDSQSISEQLSA